MLEEIFLRETQRQNGASVLPFDRKGASKANARFAFNPGYRRGLAREYRANGLQTVRQGPGRKAIPV
jgi:hypothetical protein